MERDDSKARETPREQHRETARIDPKEPVSRDSGLQARPPAQSGFPSRPVAESGFPRRGPEQDSRAKPQEETPRQPQRSHGDRQQVPDKALDDRIAQHLQDPKSLAGEALRRGADFRDALHKMDPDIRREYREQLIAELLHNDVFSESAYARVSEGRATQWEQLHDSQKYQLFRDAERLTAYCEGREVSPLTVTQGDNRGGFDPESQRIELDHDRTMNYRVPEREALRAFFHEQVHALQWAAVRDPESHPEFTASQRDDWAHNFEHYKPSGSHPEEKLEYWNQPIERHAREVAEERLKRIDDLRRRETR